MIRGLVLGVRENANKTFHLTNSWSKLNSNVREEVLRQLNISGPLSTGKARLFYGVSDDFPVISVANIGKVDSPRESDHIDQHRESIRLGIASGLRCLRELKLNYSKTLIDDCDDAEAVAESSNLFNYSFNELKDESKHVKPLPLELFEPSLEVTKKWKTGEILAASQNLARRLGETPANMLTPEIFAQQAAELTKGTRIKLIVRDKKWIEEEKMGLLLGVSRGSIQTPKFIEIHLTTDEKLPKLAFIGKGVTYDSGGYSLKPSDAMLEMKNDMAGAATVLSSLIGLDKLDVPVNIVGLLPLCENLISGDAFKVGDILRASNGKTVHIGNTDAEGRLILADAICYSRKFSPQTLLSIATLTPVVQIFADTHVAVFTNQDELYAKMYQAAVHVGDRVWRLPIPDQMRKNLTTGIISDINNFSGKFASSLHGAAFVKEFIEAPQWVQVDFANVDYAKDDKGYLGKGVTGKPLRVLMHFINSVFHQKLI